MKNEKMETTHAWAAREPFFHFAFSILHSAKLRFALLDERGHALAHVLRGEEEVEVLALVVEALLDREVERLQDRVLGKLDGDRRLAGDLGGEGLRLVQVRLVRHDLGDQPSGERLAGGDRAAGQDDLHRAGFAKRAGEALGAARAGDDTDVDLRLAEASALGGDDQVAGHRQLVAATEAEAADGRDQRLADLADAL